MSTEDCKCWAWSFVEPAVQPPHVRITRSAEYPHCVLIAVDTDNLETTTTTLALEFVLSKHPSRFLTIGGETALGAAFSKLPVRSLIDKNKFVARHAKHYCDSQTPSAQQVHPCLDTPPFVLHLSVSAAKERSTLFWVISGVGIVGGFSAALFVASAVQSRIKED